MKNSLKRDYVSEIDQFFEDFDVKNPQKSMAQQHEIKKHAQIAQRRDEPVTQEASNLKKDIWLKF